MRFEWWWGIVTIFAAGTALGDPTHACLFHSQLGAWTFHGLALVCGVVMVHRSTKKVQ